MHGSQRLQAQAVHRSPCWVLPVMVCPGRNNPTICAGHSTVGFAVGPRSLLFSAVCKHWCCQSCLHQTLAGWLAYAGACAPSSQKQAPPCGSSQPSKSSPGTQQSRLHRWSRLFEPRCAAAQTPPGASPADATAYRRPWTSPATGSGMNSWLHSSPAVHPTVGYCCRPLSTHSQRLRSRSRL